MTDKKLTNYDRIKAMSVEELAELMVSQIINSSENIINQNQDITATHIEELKKSIFKWCLKWLESEVESE